MLNSTRMLLRPSAEVEEITRTPETPVDGLLEGLGDLVVDHRAAAPW
jgi:hypothetical protein